MLFISCNRDEEEIGDNEPIISAITKSELESVPSFTYRDNTGNVLYIKFRNGKLYTKEVASSGFECNKDVMTYTLNDNKIDITFDMYYYSSSLQFGGTIQKIVKKGETKKLKLDLDQNIQTAFWLSHTYEWGSTDF